MKLDLLAIAAHPDDVELTCGGTLLKAAEQGYKTGILDLTAGEMGTRGTPETRLKEAARAAKILRVAHRENLRLPDAHLEVNEEYKLAVARRIRALKPHTVILPYWEGRHPDHYTPRGWVMKAAFWRDSSNCRSRAKRFVPLRFSIRPSITATCAPPLSWTSRAISTGGIEPFWRTARSSAPKPRTKNLKWTSPWIGCTTK